MRCPECKSEMVKSQMLFGQEFDYCRECKKELSELIVTNPFKSPTPVKTVTLPVNPRLQPGWQPGPQDTWPTSIDGAFIDPDDDVDLILDDGGD